MSHPVPKPTVASTTRRERLVTWMHDNRLASIIMGVLLFLLVLLVIWLVLFLNGSLAGSNDSLRSMPGVTSSVTAPVPGTESPAPSASAPAATPTGTPSDTPSASAAPSPSPSQNCSPPPLSSDTQLALVQVEPASNLDIMAGHKGHGLTGAVYNGEFADAATMGKWLDATQCDGLTAFIMADKLFEKNLSDSDQQAWITEVMKHGHLVNWIVDGRKSDCARRQSVLNATTVGTLVWGNWPLNDPENICTPTLPVYEPFPEPNTYGPIDNYKKVAHDIFANNRQQSWVGGQGFDISAANPAQAANFGMKPGKPSAADVGHFIDLIKSEHVTRFMINVEGKEDVGNDVLDTASQHLR